MALTNISTLGTTTHAEAHTLVQGSETIIGTPALAYDSNFATDYEYKTSHGGDGSCEGNVTLTYTWSTPMRITRVIAKEEQSTYGGNYKQSQRTYQISLLISGVWSLIQDVYTADGAGSNSEYIDTINFDDSSGWNVVTGIKCYMRGMAYSYEGDRQQWSGLRIYELQAWGNVYNDSGMRYSKGGVSYDIGMETLTASHKLRYNKAGTIYGIPLLAIDDVDASPIRIYDGSVVKALPKATV